MSWTSGLNAPKLGLLFLVFFGFFSSSLNWSPVFSQSFSQSFVAEINKCHVIFPCQKQKQITTETASLDETGAAIKVAVAEFQK